MKKKRIYDSLSSRAQGVVGVTTTGKFAGTYLTQCPFCRELDRVEGTPSGLVAFEQGVAPHLIWPHATPAVIEQILTGICDRCWQESFPDQ
jgi:hypothetical protein